MAGALLRGARDVWRKENGPSGKRVRFFERSYFIIVYGLNVPRMLLEQIRVEKVLPIRK